MPSGPQAFQNQLRTCASRDRLLHASVQPDKTQTSGKPAEKEPEAPAKEATDAGAASQKAGREAKNGLENQARGHNRCASGRRPEDARPTGRRNPPRPKPPSGDFKTFSTHWSTTVDVEPCSAHKISA